MSAYTIWLDLKNPKKNTENLRARIKEHALQDGLPDWLLRKLVLEDVRESSQKVIEDSNEAAQEGPGEDSKSEVLERLGEEFVGGTISRETLEAFLEACPEMTSNQIFKSEIWVGLSIESRQAIICARQLFAVSNLVDKEEWEKVTNALNLFNQGRIATPDWLRKLCIGYC